MRRVWCAGGLLGVSILIGQPAANATALLPGDALSTEGIGEPVGVDTTAYVGEVLGKAGYDLPPENGVPTSVELGLGILSGVLPAQNGKVVAAYQPGFLTAELPPDPTHPHNYEPMGIPADSVLSISGFGQTALDVSTTTGFNGLSSVGTISRSANGDVVSLSGFNLERQGPPPTIYFSDPSVTFGTTTGTLTFTDPEGEERSLSMDVIGVVGSSNAVPEPGIVSLMGLAGMGLMARFRRR